MNITERKRIPGGGYLMPHTPTEMAAKFVQAFNIASEQARMWAETEPVPTFGNLVLCTTGGWMVLPPQHCRRGTSSARIRSWWAASRALAAAMVVTTTWTCSACQETIYAPATGAGCRLLDAAAFKR